MATHIHTSFTGLEVETGKQAEGENLSTLQAIQSLSRSYSQSDTREQQRKLKEKKKSNIRGDDDSKGCDEIMAS